jgi:hypothetical protein
LRISKCQALCWKFSKRPANVSGSRMRGSSSRAFGLEVDQRVAGDDDGDLILVQVLQLGDGLGVGDTRSVHDDLACVQVLVHRGAGTAAAAGAVEAQSSRHDRESFRRGDLPIQHHGERLPVYSIRPTFTRNMA